MLTWAVGEHESRRHVVDRVDSDFRLAACGHVIRFPVELDGPDLLAKKHGTSACEPCLYAMGAPVRSEYRVVAGLALVPTVVIEAAGGGGGRHRMDRPTLQMPALREVPSAGRNKMDVPGSGYLPGTGDDSIPLVA
ncbi:hypothetical protein GCM10027563_19210 [Parasphingorhabdus pacifica]